MTGEPKRGFASEVEAARSKVESEPAAPTAIVGRRTGIAIAAAFVLANLSNYSFQIIAGRQLSVEEYGLLGGFMAMITIITVTTSALQVISARAIAAGEAVPSRRHADGLTRSALKVGGLVAVALVLISPILGRLLRIGIVPVLLLAAYLIPACLDSLAAGRLQGERRFRGLATYSASQAVAKVLLAAIVLAAGATVHGLLGAVIGSSLVVAFVGLRSTARAGSVETHVLGSEARTSFAALALFWLILSIDVPIARATFDGDDAGLYAAGAVLGKAVLWLPIVVAQLVFPALASPNTGDVQSTSLMRRGLGMVIALAGVSVAALYLFGETIYRVLYGDRYASSADVAWKVGLAVIPLAVVNLLMLQLLARRGTGFLRWLVAAAILEVALLQVVPQTASWYALSLAAIGLLLLIPMALASRKLGVDAATKHPGFTGGGPTTGPQ